MKDKQTETLTYIYETLFIQSAAQDFEGSFVLTVYTVAFAAYFKLFV